MGIVEFLRAPSRHIYNMGDVTWEWTSRDRIIAASALAATAITSVMLLTPSKADSEPQHTPPVQQTHIVETE